MRAYRGFEQGFPVNDATHTALTSPGAPTLDSLPDYSTTEEVAELYRTVPGTVRYWRHKGRLQGVRVGKRRLYPRAELIRFDAELRAAAELAS